MKKEMLFGICLMMAILLTSCSGTDAPPPVPAKKAIGEHAVKFMTIEALEEAGFEHIGGNYFDMLFIGESLYILNSKDLLLAKFTGNELQRVFKARSGQGPQEMITPRSLFAYNDARLVVHDDLRRSVILFDLDLNYIKEIKLEKGFKRMGRVGKKIVGAFFKNEENMFAILDDNFRITRTVVKANQKIPFERVYKHNLNAGFLLDDNLVSNSYSLFLYKQCKLNIYDIDTGKLFLTLNWEQPFSPTAKSIKEKKNCYFLYHAGKCGSYYVVHTSHSRTLLGSRRHREFRIFDRKGVLKYLDDFSNRIIQVSKETPDSKLYFMDDDEGISYIDIEEYMK